MSQGFPALMDPELYAYGDPHAVWRRLRRECPVLWHDAPSHAGFWVVTTYAPGHQVLLDWKHYSSANGILLRPNVSDPYPGAGKMLALTDPPRHDVLRRAIWRLFTPRAVAGLEERARGVVRRLLADAVDAGQCDFVGDIAAKIPLVLSANLLGVPLEDIESLETATKSAAAHADEPAGAESREAHYELLMYYSRMLERRRVDPGEDVVSVLAKAQLNGVDITDEEIVLTCDNIIVAAGETTRHASGSGLLALLEHPDQLDALRNGDVSPQSAVDEILRWAPPVAHILRTVTTDTTLEGVPIRAGDAVTVWLPSVNRDETVFGDGDEFRLDRHPNRHLTFGGGVHFCLGAALARLVLRILLEELIDGTKEIALAGRPRRLASYMLNGLSALPVSLRA